MPRQKKKEGATNTPRRFFQVPQEKEVESQMEATGEPLLAEIKRLLEGELQGTGSELRKLEADFKTLDVIVQK